jgi:hypothetical protein
MVDRRVGEETAMRMVNRSTLALLAALVAVLAFMAGSAKAIEPGFELFKVTPTDTQAGGHPDVSVNLQFSQGTYIGGGSEEGENLFARTVAVHWPEGFIGNPHVAPKCTLTEFNQARCPVDSQIGRFTLLGLGSENQGLFVPLYNMETNPDQAGLLAFTAPILDFPIFFELTGRTDSDYGLDAKTTPTLRLPFNHFKTTLWGVPASPKHLTDRFVSPLTGVGACYEGFFGPDVIGCPPGTPYASLTYATATAPERPFLQNPTTCATELTVSGDVEYYGGTVGHVDAEWPNTTGCQQASFGPSLVAKPTTADADTASGLDTDLVVPQTQSPVTPSPSELKSTSITLPPGFTINPNAADGKLACPQTLTAIGTLFGAECPEFSKIGSLVLDVAALPAPIPGAMYLLEPKPGERFRILIAADGFATHIKLQGHVITDPQTGQLTVAFDKLPQSPLQEFDVHIFGSERGLFATPSKCGTLPVKTTFTPWNNTLTERTLESFMTFSSGPNGSPCPAGPRPFNPPMQSGSQNSTAASHSPFSLILNRSDGEQNLRGITVSTPPGFAATLKGVPYCPQSALDQLADPSYTGLAEQASSACPAASQIGSAVAGAGAGSHPLYVGGKVYLAGPYKGAPLSLEVVIPAVSGPYDLGVVAVRAAIKVNPVTAQVTTTADPLPQIIEGVPLRTRYIRVNLDRPNFAVNPTNCESFNVNGGLLGDEGGSSSPSNHYQATNCADLPYGPKLSLNLTGGVRRLGHPAIHAVFSAQPGESNTRVVQVTLPKDEQLDNAHLGTICTRPDFAADNCPAGSLIGTATANTPLLDQPLKGNVYLRANPAHELPDLAVDLEGQFEVELAARIDTGKGGGLRTTFETVPDAPVSSVVLDLQGGSKGLLQNSESLCGKTKKAATHLIGQNGAIVDTKTKLQAACGKARHKRHHKGEGQ